MKIYVASSWRNKRQPTLVRQLREDGYEVYDFRDDGFHWSDISAGWETWNSREYINALKHPVVRKGFNKDMSALKEADAVVLVLPCGRSAHLELGYAVGQNKFTVVWLDGQSEPELMYKMTDLLVENIDGVLASLRQASI